MVRAAFSLLFTILQCALCVITAFTTHASDVHTSYGVSLFGNLKYPQNFQHFNYVNPNAPKGGNVTLAATGTFDSLNPFVLKGVPAQGLGLLFDTLMVSSSDEPSSGYGLVAKSVEMPDDRNWIIFNLRKNARWQDEVLLTADDVVFSFRELKKNGHPVYRSLYQQISSVEKLGDYRVKFTFSDNTNRELPVIIGQLPILPKHYFITHKFTDATLTSILGSGPYRIASINPGRSITYERVKNYWAKDLPVNIGRYNFDKITIDYYRDATVTVEAFKAGEFDFRRENISKVWTKSYNMPEIKDDEVIKEELPDGTPTGMQAFIFNLRRPLFQNRKFREALSYAYDFEWANEQLFYGAYTRNRSFFGNSKFESTGLPSKAELELLEPYRDILPKEVFTKEYQPPINHYLKDGRAHLLRAQKLLEEAGFFLRNMRLINPETNQPVTIEFLLVSPAFERVIAPFIRNLKKLGIEGSIRLVDSSQYIKRSETFDFDIMVNWFTQSASPGTEQMDYWHSSRADVNGSKNLVGIKNPAVDALVEKLTSATSYKEQLIAAHALDRVLQWNFYVIPQWYSRSHRVIYWNKFGRPPTIPPYSLGMIENWWIDKKKEQTLEDKRGR
jgi:microcin C transport system substrate-binding protein